MEPTLAQQLLDSLVELDSAPYKNYDAYLPLMTRALIGILDNLERHNE